MVGTVVLLYILLLPSLFHLSLSVTSPGKQACIKVASVLFQGISFAISLVPIMEPTEFECWKATGDFPKHLPNCSSSCRP